MVKITQCINPITGRRVQIGGKKLVREGYINDDSNDNSIYNYEIKNKPRTKKLGQEN